MNKLGKLFKTINKKQARIISVVFALALIALVYDLIKDINSGLKLGDLKYSILLTLAVVLIEFSMIAIAVSGNKDTEEESSEEAIPLPEGKNENEGSEEFTEGLNEEFGGSGSGDEGTEGSGESGGAGDAG